MAAISLLCAKSTGGKELSYHIEGYVPVENVCVCDVLHCHVITNWKSALTFQTFVDLFFDREVSELSCLISELVDLCMYLVEDVLS